jgi:hypothetical protein
MINTAKNMVRRATFQARRAVGISSKTPASPTDRHLRDPQVRQALAVITDTLHDRHRERLSEELQTGIFSPLTRYAIHLAFLETVSTPVRPLALHPQIGEWLLTLPADEGRYYPADPCWQCGYKYPGTSTPSEHNGSESSRPKATDPLHPWAGHRCLYCGGEIANHLEWLSTNPRRTLADFQNAPYRLQQQSIKPEVALPPGSELPSNELEID